MNAAGIFPSGGLLFQTEQTTEQHAPICQVNEEGAATATKVSKSSLRRTQRSAMESCITGCRDDEDERLFTTPSHPVLLYPLSFLHSDVPSFSRTIFVPPLSPSILVIKSPQDVFFILFSYLLCLTVYHHLISPQLNLCSFSFTYLPSSSSSPSLFLSEGAVNILVCASTFTFNTASRFMA